jgi:hypothetical protein
MPLIVDPALSYSTYLGGNNLDAANAIAVDASGNAYVTGVTYSSNFSTSPGAFQSTYSGGGDTFVTKLNPNGSIAFYSTYLGGTSDDFVRGIAVSASGNAYVTGITQSSDFPTTAGAFQTACGAGDCSAYEAFVTELNPSGSALVYSTYLGGSGGVQGGSR